ncbi:MAG: UDP-N-acetylmuramoyl-L-alanyl-D-glutamate--2,6-diaminopimelate ligase [Salinivirgaceae bacterium]|jgi:UDP-N-acetylmuramoyl-L-alanyl-D-glutamate--2,6-diaminopimelate ligase|nr:UDP-N-acetylmuramoyl-L-alanyl-D-glutamate--2,6-diaminopimelate ligase [Bacteroidales bacterium]
MRLERVLKGISVESIQGDDSIDISSICIDSRKCTQDSLFAAICGTNADGHNFIETAINNGATAILCQNLPETLMQNVVYVKVKDSSNALGMAASNFYDNPSEKLKLVGITGTNGKTTTATLLYKIVSDLGYPCGLFSTVKILINNKEYPSSLTTPDAIELNRIMAEMVTSGCEYCFMEVSSHSIIQNRIAGLHFVGGVFTNITQDHLDYHKTMDSYIAAKQLFFTMLPPKSFALYNTDDKNGKIMVQNSKANKKTYGLLRPANFKAKLISKQLEGMLLDINNIEIWTSLTGEFNSYNLLAAFGTCILLGFEQQETLTAISRQQPVKGRFERYMSKSGVFVIVDYAHTPDAVTNVLQTIHDIRTGDEKVITVIGAGGDRDKTKRPLMAQEAAKQSDMVILTSDNPRSEEPLAIIADMEAGLKEIHKSVYIKNPDRREAIKTACTMAQQGDIILIAGKGHENYQEIKGVRHPFDDMVEAIAILKTIDK